MDAQTWSAVAAGLAALTTVLAVLLALWSERDRRREASHALRREFQDDLYDKLYPRLVDRLGVDDGLDPELRKTLVPFFELYARVWVARACFGSADETWNGMRANFEWWARHPRSRAAWAAMRRYENTWAEGFVAYVDGVLAAPGPQVGYPAHAVTSGPDAHGA